MPNSASLTLDGTGDYAYRTGDDAVLDLTTTWTIETWLYSTTYNSADILLVSKGSRAWDDCPYYLQIAFNTLYAGYESGFTDYEVTYDISGLSTSTWHHMAATYQSNLVRIYLDGALVATSGSLGTTPPVSTYRFAVGAQDVAGTFSATVTACKQDEVRVWNVRRSDAEMTDYYNKQAVGNETGLVGCWRFNSAATDETANALTLTLAGNATYDTSIYPSLTDAGSLTAGEILAALQPRIPYPRRRTEVSAY